MQMTLYHNSAAVSSLLPLHAGMGFDLGKGWRTSYSAQIIGLPGGDRLVVHDDGTWDRHRYYNGSLWIPPAGVFQVLQKTNPITWRLTYKDQSYREFDSLGGRLTRVVDAVGNILTITRIMVEEAFVEHMAFVTDAAGRQLQFEYDINEPTRLIAILDNSWDVGERRWEFHYDTYDRLSEVIFPIDNDPVTNAKIALAYDASGRITSITDKRNPLANPAEPTNTYTLTYDGNQVATITDPTPQTGSPLTQQFATTCAGGIFMPDVFTAYTDRRGAEWVYHSVRPNPETSPENGPIAAVQNPLGNIQTFVHNINRLLAAYRDPLGHGWDYGYDAQGNRNLATDPLNTARTHQWTFDAYNNVKTYTDPLGNVTGYRYHYEDVSGGYKTLVTKITEPPDGQGNPAADTVMEYYLATPPIDCGSNPGSAHCKHGLLKKVTDPNGVVTTFDYDGFGQQSKYEEGVAPSQSGLCHLVITLLKDSRGRTRETCLERSACFGMQTQQACFGSAHNHANQQSSGGCAIPDLARPGPPGSLPPLLEAFPKTACAARALPSFGGTWTATYAGNGTLQEMAREVIMAEGQTVLEDSLRTERSQYDELSALSVASVESDEYAGGTPQTRQFTYTYDRAGGNYTRYGPDGMRTIIEEDTAGRVQSLARGPGAGPANMTAAYTYFVDDRLETATLGNGAAVAYSYDTAGRLSTIQHLQPPYDFTITYAYDARDLPISMTEISSFLGSATVNFGYDNRGRLIHETRTGDTAYDLTYTYDQGGNRQQKTDAVDQRRTQYDYDVENPAGYGSNGNRLMKALVFDTSPEP
ncbi:MAG: RHS repeat protein, partial [Planctomycetes bacterium]|nr:RHS repeat protein [Planctomycetota bacterium]